MNGFELASIIEKDSKLANNVVGIYSFDTIPKNFGNHKGLIFNNEISSRSGSHWLSLFKINANTIEFYDSFGLDPEVYGLSSEHPFLQKYNIIYRNKQIQSIDSEICGLYAIYYLEHRVLGHPLSAIFEKFGEDYYLNDKIIINHYAKI